MCLLGGVPVCCERKNDIWKLIPLLSDKLLNIRAPKSIAEYFSAFCSSCLKHLGAVGPMQCRTLCLTSR